MSKQWPSACERRALKAGRRNGCSMRRSRCRKISRRRCRSLRNIARRSMVAGASARHVSPPGAAGRLPSAVGSSTGDASGCHNWAGVENRRKGSVGQLDWVRRERRVAVARQTHLNGRTPPGAGFPFARQPSLLKRRKAEIAPSATILRRPYCLRRCFGADLPPFVHRGPHHFGKARSDNLNHEFVEARPDIHSGEPCARP